MQSHDHDEYFYDPDEADDDADEESDHEYFSACLTQERPFEQEFWFTGISDNIYTTMY